MAKKTKGRKRRERKRRHPDRPAQDPSKPKVRLRKRGRLAPQGEGTVETIEHQEADGKPKLETPMCPHDCHGFPGTDQDTAVGFTHRCSHGFAWKYMGGGSWTRHQEADTMDALLLYPSEKELAAAALAEGDEDAEEEEPCPPDVPPEPPPSDDEFEAAIESDEEAADPYTGNLPEWAKDRIHFNTDGVLLRWWDRFKILKHGRVFFDIRINTAVQQPRCDQKTSLTVPPFFWKGKTREQRAAETMENLGFDDWMTALDIEAVKYGLTGSARPSTLGVEVWHPFWQDGDTPEKALHRGLFSFRDPGKDEKKDEARGEDAEAGAD